MDAVCWLASYLSVTVQFPRSHLPTENEAHVPAPLCGPHTCAITRLSCVWVPRDAKYHIEVSRIKNIGLKGILTMKQSIDNNSKSHQGTKNSNLNNESSLSVKISMIKGENNTIAGGRRGKTPCLPLFSVMTLLESNLTKYFQSHRNIRSRSPNNSLLGSEPRDIILCLRKKSNIYINFLRHYL